ncbi:MAG: hypothetical protein FH758_03840 [Firmicutes bacterium]|nr:hypothetical protein [Bacillota bacterium]
MRNEAILQWIYQGVFESFLDYNKFQHRLNTQKAVYLLQSMGLNFGNYHYGWYKHGPYSQSVQDDAYHALNIDPETIEVNFSDYAKGCISRLKKYISDNPGSYNDSTWLEAIASAHFLHKFTYPTYNKQQLLEELKRRKPHLADDNSNELALEIVWDLH